MMEHNANQFARDILMPNKIFNRFYNITGNNIGLLSDIFETPYLEVTNKIIKYILGHY